MKTTLFASAALLPLCSISAPASAQSAGDEQGSTEGQTDASSELEQERNVIIVTARKRDETLESVPVAISAFTEKTIEDAGIEEIADVAQLTPGFTFTPLFGGAISTPVIRGQSTTIGEPNVGFFVDGVYQSSRAIMDSMLGSDIERIEVVKGPQSALYGRNTFGGAVNYITKSPEEYLSGRVYGAIGDYEQREIRLNLNGPIAPDLLYFSVGGSYVHDGGYFENSLTGEDLDDNTTKVLTGTLELRPSSALSVRLRAGYEDTDRRDFPLGFIPNNSVLANPAGPPFPNANQLVLGNIPAPDTFAVTPGLNDRNFLTTSLTIEAEVGSHTITSITGYNKLDIDTAADLDYQARDLRYQTQVSDLKEFSQELRIASPGDQAITYLFGAYYYGLRSDTLIDDRIGADALPLASAIPQSLRGLLQGGVTNELDEETDSYAVFGQVAAELGDRVTITAEGRYTSETKRVVATDISQFGGVPGTFSDEVTFESFVPRFIIDFQASDNVLLYASAAKAEKAGGFNVVTTTGAILDSERTYDPENAWTYEIGIKGSTPDRAFSGSADIYLIKWEDQIVRALGQTLAVLNTNAGQTTVKGLEIEGHLRPARGVTFDLTYAYTDARYDEYTFGALAGLGLDPILDGRILQYVSEHTVSASAQYEAPLTDAIDLFLRGDVSLQSEQSAVQPANSFIGDATLVNLRAGVDFGNFELRIFVENLTEEDAPPAAFYLPSASARFDFVASAVGAGPFVGLEAFGALSQARRPRSFGASLAFDF